MAVQVPVRAPVEQPPIAGVNPPASTAGPAAPQPPAHTRLSVAKHEEASPAQAVTPPAAPSHPQRPPSPAPMISPSALLAEASEKRRKRKRLLTIASLIIVLGVGAYFGLPAILSSEDKVESVRETDSKKGGGRNTAPSATDAALAQQGTTANSAAAGTVASPAWTLDLEAATIPEGPANGMIAGKTFIADNARLDPVGQMQLLTLRQGGKTYADREILVYLRLKPGETLEGRTWSVDPTVTAGIPQIIKRWLGDPKSPPLTKPFVSGYAMKLEFGHPQDGGLPGKIYVALPDDEKTVVGGTFTARLVVPARPPPPLVPAVGRK
ncbi:MAG TPA: hypothetical protein VK633_09735 [Verrucomicrobiae bacterium]|nr:hypothetical protein [Verrucomicrobiae bacterium]